jgi:hypothetical protein
VEKVTTVAAAQRLSAVPARLHRIGDTAQVGRVAVVVATATAFLLAAPALVLVPPALVRIVRMRHVNIISVPIGRYL